ncbi:MAG: phospholipase D-like domain-containing protein [Vicinamibacterales bacterium]
MKLIIQPDEGIKPLMKAVRTAKRSIDLVVFRFDRTDLEKALGAAVARGVAVRMLTAHHNSAGEKRLRELESRLLEAGVTVTRTSDDLPRYHGKMTIIDGAAYILGFNYTRQDIEESRSFGLVTRDKKLVKEATRLFEADSTRQPWEPADKRLVVSPENSRQRLTDFIRSARKELLIYDQRITDKLILRLLKERLEAGVEIRVIGKIDKSAEGISSCKPGDLRLHVRAMVRDGSAVFIGSQSLRKNELDARREIGLIVTDRRMAAKVRAVFEADWANGRVKGKDIAEVEMKAEAKTIKAEVKAEIKAENKAEEKEATSVA